MKSLEILKERLFHNKKAVAGLDVFLSVITMVFVIGLLVMIFAMMGGELKTSSTDATANNIIGNTTKAISGATDYFGIIITITAMVVLILLTVIIIRAIRGSGLVGGGEM